MDTTDGMPSSSFDTCCGEHPGGGGTSTNNGPLLPFKLLAGEVLYHHGSSVNGTVALTNYRLYLQTGDNHHHVPLGLIEQVEHRELFHLHVGCKDARTYRFTFENNENCLEWFDRISKAAESPKQLDQIFAFYNFLYTQDEEKNKNSYQSFKYDEEKFKKEMKRLQIEGDTWRISMANKEYKLCPTYPPFLIVPSSIPDVMLDAVAKFRSSRRVPAVVWRHTGNGAVIARCSQPEVGWLGWRSSEDEAMIKALSEACSYKEQNRHEGDISTTTAVLSHSPPNSVHSEDLLTITPKIDNKKERKVLIMDARSYTTAFANRVRGGGHECPEYYPNCEIQFMYLANIHSIRKSFHALRLLCTSSADQPNWFSQLENTRWLQHMSGLMKAAVTLANAVEGEARPVLVHCSDGWDRTPQIVALAELLLDPHYRTMEGFQTLIEREWLAFGHKFADRCGQSTGSDDQNERCPVFLQWLDCVHQLVRQFPCAFEFSHTYLVKLAQHIYSNLYGTFLCNTLQEREKHVVGKTFSVWEFLNSSRFKNHLYASPVNTLGFKVLWPQCNVRDLQLWSEVYLGSWETNFSAEGGSGSCPGPPDTSPQHMTKTRSYGDLLNAAEACPSQFRRCSDPSINIDKKLTAVLTATSETSQESSGPNTIGNGTTTAGLSETTASMVNGHNHKNSSTSVIPSAQTPPIPVISSSSTNNITNGNFFCHTDLGLKLLKSSLDDTLDGSGTTSDCNGDCIYNKNGLLQQQQQELNRNGDASCCSAYDAPPPMLFDLDTDTYCNNGGATCCCCTECGESVNRNRNDSVTRHRGGGCDRCGADGDLDRKHQRLQKQSPDSVFFSDVVTDFRSNNVINNRYDNATRKTATACDALDDENNQKTDLTRHTTTATLDNSVATKTSDLLLFTDSSGVAGQTPSIATSINNFGGGGSSRIGKSNDSATIVDNNASFSDDNDEVSEDDGEECSTTEKSESKSENTMCGGGPELICLKSIETSTDTLVSDLANLSSSPYEMNGFEKVPRPVDVTDSSDGCKECTKNTKMVNISSNQHNNINNKATAAPASNRYSTSPMCSRTSSCSGWDHSFSGGGGGSGSCPQQEQQMALLHTKHSISLGDDGLVPVRCVAQERLWQIIEEHRRKEEQLEKELHTYRQALIKQFCHKCSNNDNEKVDETSDESETDSSSSSNCSTSRSESKSPLRRLPRNSRVVLSSRDLAGVAKRGSVGESVGSAGEGQSSVVESLRSDMSWEALEENAWPDCPPATLWVPDHAVTKCTGCQTEFWVGKRKHHCRKCGKIFCASCSENSTPLPSEQLYNPVRVCTWCYMKLRRDRQQHNLQLQQQHLLQQRTHDLATNNGTSLPLVGAATVTTSSTMTATATLPPPTDQCKHHNGAQTTNNNAPQITASSN